MLVEMDTRRELPSGEERLALLREMVQNGTAQTLKYDNMDGALILDIFTASYLVQVADRLNEQNKAKFLSMDLGRMVDVMWKVVGKAK